MPSLLSPSGGYYVCFCQPALCNLQGGSAHALILSWVCWSGIWPRLEIHRLAVPKDPRFGPPPWSFVADLWSFVGDLCWFVGDLWSFVADVWSFLWYIVYITLYIYIFYIYYIIFFSFFIAWPWPTHSPWRIWTRALGLPKKNWARAAERSKASLTPP